MCGNTADNRVHTAREMMFGLRHSWQYLECSVCGCLQLENPPSGSAMAVYYPPEYYSFAERAPTTVFSLMRRWLKRQRGRHHLHLSNYGGRFLTAVWGVPPMMRWLSLLKATTDSAILDVGCGSGDLLFDMADVGFSDLTGVDPFLPHDIFYPATPGVNTASVQLRSSELFVLESESKRYDCIMFHHSLEHCAEPQAMLATAARLLNEGGSIVVRIPVADSFAWKTYHTDWVQLDAPRHYFVPTVRSMNILAQRTGLSVEHVVYDSTALQFWGSEQYRQNIALHEPCSFAVRPSRSLFSKRQIREMEEQAVHLNEQQQGDQACFILAKKHTVQEH